MDWRWHAEAYVAARCPFGCPEPPTARLAQWRLAPRFRKSSSTTPRATPSSSFESCAQAAPPQRAVHALRAPFEAALGLENNRDFRKEVRAS